MSRRKTERLLNLTWALMATRQHLTKDQIRESVAGYESNSDDAFDRMFERDKEELRELGVPIEAGEFADEMGYRISPDTAILPDLDLTPEEAAVIGLAAHVWEHSGLAGQSAQAIAKLKAVGVDVDTDAVGVAEPRLSAGEAAFDQVWDAVHARMPIRFSYQRPGHEPSTRTLEPWGVVNWRGRWYVGGFDRDRQAPRLFRLGRMSSDVSKAGPAGSYEIPEHTDWREVAYGLFGAPPTEAAVLRIRADRGHWLRRRAESVTTGADGFDEVHIRYGSVEDLAAEVASYGPDVLVVGPGPLRDATLRRLRRAAGAAS